MMRFLVQRGFGFLAVCCLAASPLFAANKDIERLAIQIAALQGQLTELQRSGEETRAELRRLAELVAEQNALLRKAAADKRQQDESMSVGLRELSERVSELAETLESIKTQTAAVAAAAERPGCRGRHPGCRRARHTAADGRRQQPARRQRRCRRRASSTARPTRTSREGNYDLAMQGFAEYLRAYPGTDFADNAQYWIGECQYGKKLYPEAIDAWNLLLKDFPSSDKLPDARVKKGMALERLGRRSQALVEYRFVVDRFPTSQAARIARERLNP